MPMERNEQHEPNPISPRYFCFDYYKYVLQLRCLQALDIAHKFIINLDKHSEMNAVIYS